MRILKWFAAVLPVTTELAVPGSADLARISAKSIRRPLCREEQFRRPTACGYGTAECVVKRDVRLVAKQGFVNYAKEWWHFSLLGAGGPAYDFPIASPGR